VLTAAETPDQQYPDGLGSGKYKVFVSDLLTEYGVNPNSLAPADEDHDISHFYDVAEKLVEDGLCATRSACLLMPWGGHLNSWLTIATPKECRWAQKSMHYGIGGGC
jgi:hypothetical protein